MKNNNKNYLKYGKLNQKDGIIKCTVQWSKLEIERCRRKPEALSCEWINYFGISLIKNIT
jgi:hypothetical protein